MESLWSPCKLGGTVLPGKIVRTAVAESYCTPGRLPLPALVGMCRPLIRDPWLALKWKEGVRDASDCVSCNGCLGESRGMHGVRCVLPL